MKGKGEMSEKKDIKIYRSIIDAVIIIGSDSDKRVVEESKMTAVLDECKIKWAISVYSAHRHDEELTKYCEEEIAKGAKVFIGAASMSAGLPGAIAAKTKREVPVIGVGLQSETGILNGLDAFLSMGNMPPGVPVLFAGFGMPGLRNASVAAVQILGTGNTVFRKYLNEYLEKTTKKSEYRYRTSLRISETKRIGGKNNE
jgi:phosphoribosylaminoimidazole carboxylase PurE protein